MIVSFYPSIHLSLPSFRILVSVNVIKGSGVGEAAFKDLGDRSHRFVLTGAGWILLDGKDCSALHTGLMLLEEGKIPPA